MESMVVFFQCRSLQKTDDFYLRTLKLKLWHSQPGCHIYDSGYGYLGFVEAPQMTLPAYSCISFNCADQREVDDWHCRLKDQPGITAPRKHPQFNVYSFFLHDPDGHTVEFQKILKEDHYE